MRDEEPPDYHMSKPTLSLLSRIRDHVQKLPPTERRLADFILDFPGEISSYSASELAKQQFDG